MSLRIILMLAAVALMGQACSNEPKCFVKKLFDFSYPKQNLYQVTLTGQTQNYSMKAYGDFNNDLKTDYVSITTTGQVQIYLFQSSNLFALASALTLPPSTTPIRVYLYDFNNDEQLDITLWCLMPNGSFILQPYANDGTGAFSILSSVQFISEQSTTDPVLIGVRVENGLNKYGFLLFDGDNGRVVIYYLNQIYQIFPFSTYFMNSAAYASTPFLSPHSNSYVDITHDCQADMLITNSNNTLQFWIFNAETGKFSLGGTQLLPALTVWTAYADVDYDGGVDVVIILNNGISVALGQGLGIQDQFCQSGKYSFQFNFNDAIYSPFADGFRLPLASSSQPPKFGDINIDGYPDIALILQNTNANSQLQPQVYQNSAGSSTFAPFNDPYNSKMTMDNLTCLSVSFFDLLQNGIVDLIVVWQGTSPPSTFTQAYYNNYLYQNDYYIKGYATGGFTADSGAQVPGASFYWINSVSDRQRVAFQPQLIQSAYDALSMPYAVLGLGHANNYVQSFTVGRAGQTRSWSPIIPNSQLAFFTGNSDPSGWAIKIFVMPTQSLIYVIIVCLVILGILGMILVAFRWKKIKGKQQSLLEVMA